MLRKTDLTSSICPNTNTDEPLIIAVEENQTVLNDTPDSLGIEAVKVSKYWEAIGVVAAHKAGIDPNSLRRNRIKNIAPTSFVPSNGYEGPAQEVVKARAMRCELNHTPLP